MSQREQLSLLDVPEVSVEYRHGCLGGARGRTPTFGHFTARLLTFEGHGEDAAEAIRDLACALRASGLSAEADTTSFDLSVRGQVDGAIAVLPVDGLAARLAAWATDAVAA